MKKKKKLLSNYSIQISVDEDTRVATQPPFCYLSQTVQACLCETYPKTECYTRRWSWYCKGHNLGGLFWNFTMIRAD